MHSHNQIVTRIALNLDTTKQGVEKYGFKDAVL